MRFQTSKNRPKFAFKHGGFCKDSHIIFSCQSLLLSTSMLNDKRKLTSSIIFAQLIWYTQIKLHIDLNAHRYSKYCIAGKFGELNLFEYLVKESLANNRSYNRLSIVSTKLDGFSLANHG